MANLSDGALRIDDSGRCNDRALCQRVLLVDIGDQESQTRAEVIASAGYFVRAAGSEVDALETIRAWSPGLVFISLAMIAESGLVTCRRIMEETSAPIVLLPTDVAQVLDRVAKLYGVDHPEREGRDLLTRAAEDASLTSAVRAKVGEVLEVGPVAIHLARRSIMVRGEKVPIRKMEYDLLLALVERAGQICTRDSLGDLLWPNGSPGLKTMDVHIRRLRAIVELDAAQPRHIVTVRKVGYYFDPDGA